jgi:hypothetical protein
MWRIIRITEADYGCEERLPGEGEKALVFLKEDETGKAKQVTVEEAFLSAKGLSEGNTWPEEKK